MFGWGILGILFFLSGTIYFAREWKFIRRNKRLMIVSYFRAMYVLTYGIIPSFLCLDYAFNGTEYALKSLIIMDYSNDALFCLYTFWGLSVIAYCMFSGAYTSMRKKTFVFNQVKRDKSRTFIKLSENQIFYTALASLCIGCFSLYMWTVDLGGVLKFIPLASGIRGDYLNTYGNTHMAWRQPARICLPASYLFFFLAIGNQYKHKIRNVFMTFVSMFVAALFLLCNDGRLTIAYYFVVLSIGFFTHATLNIKNPKKFFLRVGALAVAAAILLAKLDSITYFFRHWEPMPSAGTEGSGIISTLVEEFLFVPKSGIVSIDTNILHFGSLKILDDLAIGLTAYIPSRFLPSGFDNIWRYNTMLCTGSSSPTMATIPCDLVSLSVYDLGLLGVFVIPVVIGSFLAQIENHFRKREEDAYHLTMYYGFVLAFLRLPSYANLNDFMLGMFAYIVLFIVAHGIRFIKEIQRR